MILFSIITYPKFLWPAWEFLKEKKIKLKPRLNKTLCFYIYLTIPWLKPKTKLYAINTWYNICSLQFSINLFYGKSQEIVDTFNLFNFLLKEVKNMQTKWKKEENVINCKRPAWFEKKIITALTNTVWRFYSPFL